MAGSTVVNTSFFTTMSMVKSVSDSLQGLQVVYYSTMSLFYMETPIISKEVLNVST